MLWSCFCQHGVSQEDIIRGNTTQPVKDMTYDLASLAHSHLSTVSVTDSCSKFDFNWWTECVVRENVYTTNPMEVFFGFDPPPHPSGNSNLVWFQLFFKNFCFSHPSPPPPTNTKCFAFWQRFRIDHEISAPFNGVCMINIIVKSTSRELFLDGFMLRQSHWCQRPPNQHQQLFCQW